MEDKVIEFLLSKGVVTYDMVKFKTVDSSDDLSIVELMVEFNEFLKKDENAKRPSCLCGHFESCHICR